MEAAQVSGKGVAGLLIKWGSLSSSSKSRPILSFSNGLAKSDAKFPSPASTTAKAEISFLFVSKGKDVQDIR